MDLFQYVIKTKHGLLAFITKYSAGGENTKVMVDRERKEGEERDTRKVSKTAPTPCLSLSVSFSWCFSPEAVLPFLFACFFNCLEKFCSEIVVHHLFSFFFFLSFFPEDKTVFSIFGFCWLKSKHLNKDPIFCLFIYSFDTQGSSSLFFLQQEPDFVAVQKYCLEEPDCTETNDPISLCKLILRVSRLCSVYITKET